MNISGFALSRILIKTAKHIALIVILLLVTRADDMRAMQLPVAVIIILAAVLHFCGRLLERSENRRIRNAE